MFIENVGKKVHNHRTQRPTKPCFSKITKWKH